MAAPWRSLLDWWFGSGPGTGFGPAADAITVAAARHGLWFGKRDHQDAEARERFGEWVEQALDGGLSDWAQSPEGWLALILLLDQLPRMIHRATPRAFAGDGRAQALARQGLERGWDARLPAIARLFIHLVFEHAEDLAVQERSVALARALHDGAPQAERELFAGFLDYAERHRRVIARFGRFPHRNDLLGRPSTPDEVLFLQQPGSRF
ncbi:MAG TPA: DUF924 family protein [Pseudomonas sp.]|nr:DUF924 family protein [Pseudomonas sp.]